MYEFATPVASDLELSYDNWMNDPATYICGACLIVSGCLAAAAGIGGGGIIVAVLMFCGQMAPHDAVPMSKAVVFAGVFVSSALNMYKTATTGGRPLVDFDIVAAVVPMALAGTLCGVWLNSRVPASVIVSALILTLLTMIVSTAKTLMEELQTEQQVENEVGGGGGPGGGQHGPRENTPLTEKAHMDPDTTRKQRVLVAALSVLLAGVILGGVLHKHMLDCHQGLTSGNLHRCESNVLAWLLGSKLDFLGGPHGSGLAAFPIVMSVVCCVLFFVANTLGCISRVPTSPTFKYSAMGFVAGVLAGLVGIGGGLVFCPFMIWCGLDVHVSIATSTFCVIFTATSTTLQYAMMGRLFFPLAIVYGVCNQVASSIGTSCMHRIQEHYPMKRSIPTMIVLVAVVLSAILTVCKLQVLLQQSGNTLSSLLGVATQSFLQQMRKV